MEHKSEIFTIEFEDFSGASNQKTITYARNDILKLADLKLKVIAQLGTSKSTVGEVSTYKVGDYIEVDRMAGHTVEVLVGQEKIAIGEVILMDNRFGLRITEVISKNGEFLRNISKNGEID